MNGVLLIDKPVGMTSRDVDNRVRRHLGRKLRIGHAGTLDPFATGLLPILIGEATKLSAYLTGARKSYRAELFLGASTNTGDCDGEVVEERAVPRFDEAAVLAAMKLQSGVIRQRVPAFSAVKVQGKRLHELARAGQIHEIELPEREITVYGWRLLALGATSVEFEVDCSAGTYVRVLGEQLAASLGTVGHLKKLRRLSSGKLSVADAVPLATALEMDADKLPLIGLEDVLEFPVIRLESEDARLVRHGRVISTPSPVDGDITQALDESGRLLALLERRTGSEGTEVWKVLRGFHST